MVLGLMPATHAQGDENAFIQRLQAAEAETELKASFGHEYLINVTDTRTAWSVQVPTESVRDELKAAHPEAPVVSSIMVIRSVDDEASTEPAGYVNIISNDDDSTSLCVTMKRGTFDAENIEVQYSFNPDLQNAEWVQGNWVFPQPKEEDLTNQITIAPGSQEELALFADMFKASDFLAIKTIDSEGNEVTLEFNIQGREDFMERFYKFMNMTQSES